MHGDERHTGEGVTAIILGKTRWVRFAAYNNIAPAEATSCSALLIVARYRKS